MDKAIVLLSGGMDSAVTASVALKDYECYFLHIDYGQRTEKKEREVFKKLVKYFRPKGHFILKLKYFKDIAISALTDRRIEVPEGLHTGNEVPVTYVPFRNGNFLAIAISLAETLSAKKIFIGATEEDSAGYPDCRKEFYENFNRLIKIGTKNRDIEIITPVISMKKSDIVKLGMKLKTPFHLTWSCYKNSKYACGKCDSCLRRLNAFKEAGLEDPIKYEKGALKWLFMLKHPLKLLYK